MELPRDDDCYVAGCGQPRAAWAKSTGWFKNVGDFTLVIPLCQKHTDLLEPHMDEVWREPSESDP